MNDETKRLIKALQEGVNATIEQLLSLDDSALDEACSHPCGRGPDGATSVWHLIANDIDHEKMHAGQILSNRHDLGLSQTPAMRLLAEWLQERAALTGALLGLADEDLDRAPKAGEWSFREIVEHTLYWERDSVAATLRELATGERWQPRPGTRFGGPVPVQGE